MWPATRRRMTATRCRPRELGIEIAFSCHKLTHNPYDLDDVHPQHVRLEVEAAGTKTIIDVTVAFDEPGNMQRAFDRKVEKYQHLSQTFPLVLGALGSWKPENEAIRSFFGIPARQWAAFRRRSRTSVIRGSLDIIHHF